MCVYHIFFIHLFIIGHLGEYRCFFDIIPFPLGIYSEMELLDHMAVLF